MDILLSHAETQIIVKNSRFLAELTPVNSQAEARETLHMYKQKYSDATHVVHAFVTGSSGEVNGMSDDGEPGGTAGRPVLDVLKGSGITNCILTVTRWFGGTLLGTGGLVKAYGDAAKAVIAVSSHEPLVEKKSFVFSADYYDYENIKRAFVNYHVSSLEENFDSLVKVSGEIWAEEYISFADRIKNLTRGKSSVSEKK